MHYFKVYIRVSACASGSVLYYTLNFTKFNYFDFIEAHKLFLFPIPNDLFFNPPFKPSYSPSANLFFPALIPIMNYQREDQTLLFSEYIMSIE